MRKIFVLGMVILATSVGVFIGSGSVRLSSADVEPQICQYPDRLSNPPGGCDNSDPACGEIAKGATSCPGDQQPTPPSAPAVAPAQNIPKCTN